MISKSVLELQKNDEIDWKEKSSAKESHVKQKLKN